MARRHHFTARHRRRLRVLCPVALLFLLGFGSPPAGGDREPPAGSGWTVDTVAGGGPVGDGGPATEARLSLPGGLLIDAAGDLIIVDFGNHRVRRVDAATGIITTIAGTGEPNFTGDGGPAHAAGLARPENAAFGPDGSLYIVDEYNHRIRRIDPESGLISTVAGNGTKGYGGDGGPALEAALNWAEGIAVDRRGDLYIGDTQNRRVRKVEMRTGRITTVAGSGESGITADGTPALEARFLRIARLAVDSRGNIYVADSPAQRIYVVDADSGLMRTFAGNGEEGASGDGGPATGARLSYPEGVLVDAADNLYWCDVGSHRVRRAERATGVVTTVAGNGERGFSGDGGPATEARLWSPGRLALDAAGNLYVADIGNARVRRVERRTGVITTVAGSGDLGDGRPARDAILTVPGDVAYARGALYVADYGNRRVRRVDLATGIITTVAGGGGRHGEDIPATEAELLLPEGVAADAAGNLYISDNIGSRVYRVDAASGLLRTFAGNGRPGFSGDGGPAVEAQLALPGSVAAAPDGTVYIADFGNRRIRVVDPATGTIRSLGGHPLLLALPVVSVAASRAGLFWISAGDPAVYRLAPGERIPERLPFAEARLLADSYLLDVAVAGEELIVADTMGHRVLVKSLATGAERVLAGSGTQGYLGDGGTALAAAFFQPGGVTGGEPGTVFIADSKNHRVRRAQLERVARHGPADGDAR